jgi:hypothetical protein
MAANSALVLEWGMPIPGREMKALEEFMNHVAWWNQLKASGKITEFKALGPITGNVAERAGMAILEGDQKQIADLLASEDFRVHFNRAAICVDNVRTTVFETGDAMTTRLQRYGKNLKELLG